MTTTLGRPHLAPAHPASKEPTVATASDRLNADIAPQSWEYTHTDGTTLTVIPADLSEDPDAEVTLRLATGTADAIEASIPSHYLPAAIDALTHNRVWTYDTLDDITIDLTPFGGGGMLLTLSEDVEAVEAPPQVHVPEAQRLPLAAALSRALEVATEAMDAHPAT